MRARKLGAALLLLAESAAAIKGTALLSRRGSISIPSPYSIGSSQTFEGNDGPWSTFPLVLGTGSQRQNVRVLPATAAYNIWTVSPNGCPAGWVDNCAEKRGGTFNVNQSITWIRDSIYPLGMERNLDLDTTARAGYDTASLGWQGSGGPEVNHTVVYNMDGQTYWLGAFGLAPFPTNFSDFNSPQKSFMQTLYDTGKIPSVSYGYTAGNQYRFSKVYGSLTLGGYDESRFADGVSWTMAEDISRDLLVTIKSITDDSGKNLLPGGQISAFVDSTVPTMWLPLSACQAFESAFGLTYNTSYNTYLVSDQLHLNLTARNPSVVFTLTNGGQDVQISLPYAAFSLNLTNPIYPGSHFYFPLSRAANDTQYTLGRVFLQEAYLIADYDRGNFTVAPCTWDQAKLSNSSIRSILSRSLTDQVNGLQSSSGRGLSAGAIAGIVVGALLFIVLLATLCISYRRSKKRRLISRNAHAWQYDHADAKLVESPHNELHNIDRSELHGLSSAELESASSLSPDKHGYSEMEGAAKVATHEVVGTVPLYELAGHDVQSARQSRYSWRQ